MSEKFPKPAARYQWKAVRKLLPTKAAYAAASYQLTPLTGWSACPSGYVLSSHVAGPGWPVLSRNSAIASSHDRVRVPETNGSVQYDRVRYPPASTNVLNWRLVTSNPAVQQSAR